MSMKCIASMLVSFALFGVVSLSLSVPVAAAAENLRYFQYWAKYGAELTSKNSYTSLLFSFSGGRVSIFLSDSEGRRENFSGSAGQTLGTELSDLIADLDFSGWEVPIDEKCRDRMTTAERKKYCLWELNVIFASRDGQPERKIHLSGADCGVNTGRLAAEKAFVDFFAGKLPACQEAAPKHIISISWRLPANGGSLWYHVSRNSDGKVSVNRICGNTDSNVFVRASLLDELQSEVQKYAAESWHGFRARDLDRKAPSYAEFCLHYDTQQEIVACGQAGVNEGLPEGMENMERGLSALCDRVIDAGGGPGSLRSDALKQFSFSESGMRRGRWPGYEIYQRMENDGPVTVLSRELGPDNISECIIHDNELQRFENLLRELHIADWNGFDRHDNRVLDGITFSLELRYWQGSGVSAHGYMKFPKGYREKMQSICAALDGMLETRGFPSP
ncbi:MAG: hypothetical protein J6I40_00745 [Mailhella sp.]|nr:hypothetical protein [Mailhella sp.]